MINKAMIERLFEAAHIQRWNDHIRPHQGFAELDKQAHKMVIAYVVARFEEKDRQVPVDWRRLIEGGLFEFFHRIVLTDIKPPIYHQLMKESGPELNAWVLDRLEPVLAPVKGGFLERFRRYFDDREESRREKRLLKAAHYLATNWEFKLIYPLNRSIYGVEQTRAAIENELEEYFDLAGVQKLGLQKKTYNFIDLVGQLRFQKRWAQSPRIPETSVMGHMLIVAMLAYLGTLELEGCERRGVNNFWAGLFHDLPEVLTRDIVSPVKRSVEGLDELIKRIEERQIEDRILPLLPEEWHEELGYFMADEFRSKIRRDGRVELVTSEEIGRRFNDDAFSPLDGELIKACDQLAAFVEAFLSIAHGVTSRHLEDGLGIAAAYRGRRLGSLDFEGIFSEFLAGGAGTGTGG